MINKGERAFRFGVTMLAMIPAFAGTTIPAFAGAQTGPTGDWLRNNGTVRIAVTQCGSSFCAVNTWVKRRNGPERLGDRIVLDMNRVADDQYQGKAYDLRRHRTYRMTVTINGDSMRTSGCVLFGIICKSAGWKRID